MALPKSFNGNISKTVSPIKLKFEAQPGTTRCKFKNTKLGHKGALSGSREILLNFWTPSNISGMAEDTNSKYSTCRLNVGDTKRKKIKNGQNGAKLWLRDKLFKCWDTPNISGTSEDTNLTFCTQTDRKGY